MKFPVLLTGAAGDICTAIVKRLVSGGYGVIGLDKNPPRGAELFLDFLVKDLTLSNQLAETCNLIKQQYCPLWGLIHCAGIYPIVPLASYTDDLWDEVQNVNLKSAFQIVRELQNEIIDGGRIVFISSGAAHLGSGDIGYSTSKAGLTGLVRGFAKGLAAKGILVNSVCPGLVMSQMSARMTPEHSSKTQQAIPLARPGRPEEVAICVSF
jgi:NAD(P)-dependent dehydrogenase (short-subunit alcohol dehydrogenase family)